MRGMVITVGVGENVHHAIVQSIETHNPVEVVFIVSSGSRDTLGKVAHELENAGYKHLAELCTKEDALVEVEDFENVDSCYEASVAAFRKLFNAGVEPRRTIADFTSGTKAMSAGLVMAASFFGCETLSYVGGIKRNGAGRVITGAGQVHSGRPSIILRDLTLMNAVEAFNHCQFQACRTLIMGLDQRVSNQLLQTAKTLSTAAEFYDAWDRFDHNTAASLCSDLKEFDKVWSLDTKANRCFVARVAKSSEGAGQNSGGDNSVFFVELAKSAGELLLADLLANARRRGDECRYDDAVARLYRAIELAAQIVFARDYGHHTGRIPEDFLIERGLESKYRSRLAEGYARLGLRDAYELLSDLDHELGKRLVSSNKILNYLNSRNESILAHGLSSVGYEAYQSLWNIAEQLCAQAVGAKSLDRELENCRFPKVRWT